MVANMAGFFACIAGHSPGASVVRQDGLTAWIVPACPRRSIVNGVAYSDTGVLVAALAGLAAEFDRAGVNAWTVWTPDYDAEAGQVLERAGHVLDARPAAMVMELDDVEPPPAGTLDLMEPDMVETTRVNDAAYGFASDFERAFSTVLPEPAHMYMARADGVPASTVVTYEQDGECGIYLVATLPEARGRGLATALMKHALVEARERGCTTTSLQASARGRLVYERLGYRDIGAMHMWERRKPV
jgi:GNAT superfamily N-acetyltransferase